MATAPCELWETPATVPATSFNEPTLLEAVARRCRVDVLIRPIANGGPTRLMSHFLGQINGDLAIAPPQTVEGKKVFLPREWELGLSFELGSWWVQGRTRVRDHIFFPLHGRRVDGVLLPQPRELVVRSRRRRETRQRLPHDQRVTAELWTTPQAGGEPRPLHMGCVGDFTSDSLGIKMVEPLSLPAGAAVVVRLQRPDAAQSLLLRANVRHCTPNPTGQWLLGLGAVEEITPNQHPELIRFLATAG